MSEFQFNTIDEILEDLRDGKIVVMIDDEDRENEGDVICAAEHATLENVNFMASYAKGLICMPMDESYTKKLGLRQMCEVNTDNHCTAFTVSIDHKDTTTGISAYERSITAMKTVDPDAVTTNGNLTMVNEYLAENGGAALGTDAVTPTPAASDGSGDNKRGRSVCKDTDGVHIRERYRNVHDAYGIEQNERLRASEGR